MAKLRSLIRDLSRGAGFDLRRYQPVIVDPYVAQHHLLRTLPCRTIFDVGAFQGEATTRYAELFPAAEIYSFEPYPPSYQALATCYDGNRRVHLVNAAISSRQGEGTFYVNGHPATNSLLPRPSSGRRYFPAVAETRQTIQVPTVTVDGFCAEQKLSGPEILKMDIQGNELEALRGAQEILASGAVQLIFSEVSFVPHYEGGVLFNDLCSHLSQRGYSLFNVYDLHSASFGQLRFGDALFVSDELRRTVIEHFAAES